MAPVSPIPSDINALLNDLVISEILSKLSVPELKNCRFVCHLWKDLSSSLLRRVSSPIKFVGNCCVKPEFQHALELSDFIECVQGSDHHPPFSKLELKTTGRRRSTPPLLPFFRSISPWVTDFGITVDESDKEWSERLVGLYALVNELVYPCLTTLRFELPVHESPGNFEDSIKLFQVILKSAPVLEQVKIECHRETEMTTILEGLENANSNKISHLTLTGKGLKNDHVTRLAQMKLELKSLTVMIYDEEVTPRDLLVAQATTLKELKISVSSRAPAHAIRFPCMKALKRVTVDLARLSAEMSEMSFPQISYVEQFPVLHSLTFLMGKGGMNSNNLEGWLREYMKPTKSVKELRFPGVKIGNGRQLLAKLGRVFPEITKLEVPAAWTKVVTEASRSWRKLEELTLNTVERDCIDVITSGLSIMKMYNVDIFTNPDPLFSNVLDRARRRTQLKPISCLEELKILRIKSNAPGFTDTSGNELLRMKSLKRLDLRGILPIYPPLQCISTEILAEMKQKFQVLV